MNKAKAITLVGFIIFVTIILGIFGFSRLEMSSSLSILPENDPAVKELKAVKKSSSEEGVILCILELKPEINGTIFESKQAIEEIEKLVELLENKETVKNVDSILEASKLEVKGFTISYKRYLESDPKEILNDPFYVNNIISRDGRTTAVIIHLKESDKNLVKELENIKLKNFYMTITGQPVVDFEIDKSVWVLATVYPALLFLLMCGVYYLRLKSFLAAILPPLSAILSAVWTYELMGIMGLPINILTASAGIFLIIITPAYGLHFVDRLIYHVKDHPTDGAIKKAIKDEWRPIFLSAITTALAFLSFLFTPLKAFRELGIIVSIGIFLSLVAVFVVIPSVVIIANAKFHSNLKNHHRKRKWKIPNLGKKKYWKYGFLVASLIMLVTSIWIIPRLEVNFDNFGYFHRNSQVRLSAQKAIKDFGWAIPLYVVVEKSSPFTMDDQKHLIDFLDKVEKLKEVNGTISALDFWRYYSIPLPLVQILSRRTDELSDLIIGNTLKITVKTPYTDSENFQKVADKIREIGSSLPKSLKLYVAGEPLAMASLNEKIMKSQMISVIFTIVFIFALMLVIFRKLSKSFLAVLPVSLTLVFNFYFMSLAGIWLEVSTSIVASILAGLVIDYSIHLMEAKNRGIAAEKQVIPVIISNSIGLILGFLTLIFSPMALYARLGILIAVGIAFGTLSTILLVSD